MQALKVRKAMDFLSSSEKVHGAAGYDKGYIVDFGIFLTLTIAYYLSRVSIFDFQVYCKVIL